MTELSAQEISEVRRLLDNQAIQDVMLRYTRAIDRNDGEAMKSIFWPEGQDDHGMYKGTAAGFMERSRANRASIASRYHLLGPSHVLSIEDEQAKVETYFLYIGVFPSDGDAETLGHLAGRYRDVFERREGVWKVLRRLVVFDSATIDEYRPAWEYYGIPTGINRGTVEPDDPTYSDEW